MGSLFKLMSKKRKMEKALEPFATFAANNVDDNGWKSNIHRERISDWFGPSEFRALREAFDAINRKGK